MYTSDIKRSRIIYIGLTVFFFIFQLIYEHFSHNVYSAYMVCAFIIPLCCGIVSELMLRQLDKRQAPYRTTGGDLLLGGCIWLTLGSLFQGVLQIYGTTNRLIIVFPIVGVLHIISAVILHCRTVSIDA